MLLYPILLFKIALMQEGQFSYSGLIKLLALLSVLLLIGAGLWQVGLELFHRSNKAQKVGGALVVAIAAAYSLGVVSLVYWEFLEIVDLF
jgi:succinate dehydrogenase hydrophobic anchor subunit